MAHSSRHWPYVGVSCCSWVYCWEPAGWEVEEVGSRGWCLCSSSVFIVCCCDQNPDLDWIGNRGGGWGGAGQTGAGPSPLQPPRFTDVWWCGVVSKQIQMHCVAMQGHRPIGPLCGSGLWYMMQCADIALPRARRAAEKQRKTRKSRRHKVYHLLSRCEVHHVRNCLRKAKPILLPMSVLIHWNQRLLISMLWTKTAKTRTHNHCMSICWKPWY